MTGRFQIEDLIAQDASGVVFRALDLQTGCNVALRRFFPFGADGGGLDAEEQAAYNIAVGRLSGLSHPALRSVVCGGCDPVDGMPFIATEWVEGEPLQQVLTHGPLSAAVASQLITSALEVSELLSHVLAEEAVWVETDIQTIMVADEAGGRDFTFWISPLKWLGGGSESRGLESVVKLTEELMGWTGRIVNDQAGRGLGGWLNWLRGAADTTSLHEAREMLATSIGAEPPESARHLVARATKPLKRSLKTPSSKAPLMAAIGFSLVVAGVGGWIWNRQVELIVPEQVSSIASDLGRAEEVPAESGKPSPAIAKQAPSAASESAADLVSRRAAELSANALRDDQAKAVILDRQVAAAEARGGVIQWNNHELLVRSDRQSVTVEGVFEAIGYSSSKKTLYLNFSTTPARNDSRGAVVLSRAGDDLAEDALTPLLGKTIRIHGPVNVQKSGGLFRPDIKITERASIEVIE